MCGSPERKCFKVTEYYISCVDHQRKCFKVEGVYISCVDHQRKCFKVAESIYHVWITKENVLKLQSLYILCGSPKKMF